ncbi:carboxypeptidase-like regulatory domain-containing protein [Hymenobacter metallilatus]|uniref:Carboxypeptidase-like regulatory domain-containing protein n=1 Tax=Hymenobacter metallilatus TaxID=2493666 RepID=A0A3R9MM54_9BACT|nr:carboxypeptidase-like regulatory domain-containing protein [Hymenobacter metallilatus]RSK35279.1 hypothetical protein EI290_06155 [Hymenobacter metallilatus]
MALTTYPFHPETGELLPVFRDAYLRGDLSPNNAALVDRYLETHSTKGDAALQRLQQLHHTGHQVRPSNWIQEQLHGLHTEPARFRQRASMVVVAAALMSGAMFAGTRLRVEEAPKEVTSVSLDAEGMAAPAVEAAASCYTTVTGRILDENGRPLVGATVLDKASGRGVSTNAEGEYSLSIPANQLTRLQYGYAGYTEEDAFVKGRRDQTITLLPKAAERKKRTWWPF